MSAGVAANVRLLSSPGPDYQDALEAAMEGATSVRLITAFATAAGLERLISPLERVLGRPNGQVRLIIAVDRQGFNAEPMFRALLALRDRYAPRVSVGLVPQTLGLLHAKALFAERVGSASLIVGSANLTQGAFVRNYELAIAIDNPAPSLVREFKKFEAALEARTLDDASAPAILCGLGMLAAERPPPDSRGADVQTSWKELLASIQRQAKLPPLPDEPAALLFGWIERGYLVGRGRRGTDALVLRVPLDDLERRGLAATTRRRSLGGSARESRTVGYQVELLPADYAAAVRRECRGASGLLSRLALALPCFGMWMPDTFWEVFTEARSRLLDGPTLNPTRLGGAAESQRRNLLEQGGLEADVDRILASMVKDDVVSETRRGDVRAYLLPELERRLLSRTPDLIADAIQFRTARQRWAPYESTDVPHRQLMVDVVQAVLSPTLQTGEWPGRIHSFVARDLARAFEQKLLAAGRDADGAMAQFLLEQASTWEWPTRDFGQVIDEFRGIVPLDHDFEPPDVEDLLRQLNDREDTDAGG